MFSIKSGIKERSLDGRL